MAAEATEYGRAGGLQSDQAVESTAAQSEEIAGVGTAGGLEAECGGLRGCLSMDKGSLSSLYRGCLFK